VPRRRYRQFCPLAKALDVLGERWTLLIVRELMTGPKRYTDLRDELPGLATDLLAARLRELHHGGIVERRDVPPPTPAVVYELTPRGHALDAVITELALWGRPLLQESIDDYLPQSALLLGIKTLFQSDAAADLDETYHLEVDGRPVAVQVHDGTVDVAPDSIAERPAVRIVTDTKGFINLARGQPQAARIEGDPDALNRLGRVLDLS